MRKLLWVGDAVVSTGFARCTHHILNTLKETWDVSVLGLNSIGDPHEYGYPIFPCWPGGDAFGLGRIGKVIEAVQPDLILIQNDPWNIIEYLRRIPESIPVAASMPVDGKNCRLAYDLAKLEGKPHARLELAIFWTEFGRNEAVDGGLRCPTEVIPLGVETDLYHQMDKRLAREALGLPEHLWDKYIVGNVNRNQPRKRLDLTIKYFAEWRKEENAKDAHLFLHVAPTGDAGYDVRQLKRYYDREEEWLIVVEPPVGTGAPEKLMPIVYNAFDLQVSTTQGEGWGLTTMEGMACGVPQVIPEWAALGEWAKKAAYSVPCTNVICTPNNINVVGGLVDRLYFKQALAACYNKKHLRERMSAAGIELVSQPQYRWPDIGRRYALAIDSLVEKEQPVVPPVEEPVGG